MTEAVEVHGQAVVEGDRGLDQADAAIADEAADDRQPAQGIDHVVEDAGEDHDVERVQPPAPELRRQVLELHLADELELRLQRPLDQVEPTVGEGPVIADHLRSPATLEQDRDHALLEADVETARALAAGAAGLDVDMAQELARQRHRPARAAGRVEPGRELDRVVPLVPSADLSAVTLGERFVGADFARVHHAQNFAASGRAECSRSTTKGSVASIVAMTSTLPAGPLTSPWREPS